MGTIAFERIPADIRKPLFYAEIDDTKAGYYSQSLRALIIGQTRNVDQDKKLQVISSADQARALFGWGSMLARQVHAFRQNNNFSELWVYSLRDMVLGTNATGTLTFSGTTTAAGSIYLYVNGMLAQVPIPAGKTAAEVAVLVRRYIVRQRAEEDLLNDLPVAITGAGAVLTFTALHKGTLGNGIDVRLNFGASGANEQLPAGLSATGSNVATPHRVVMAGGAGDPSIDQALAALGSEPFDYIIQPYTDGSTLDTLRDFLDARWEWDQAQYGIAIAAKRDTVSALYTFGGTRNSPRESVFGYDNSVAWEVEVGAAYGGVLSRSLTADPARTVQSLPLIGILPPATASRWTVQEEDMLLKNGVSTGYEENGMFRISRAITTYQENAWGAQDTAWLDVTTPATVARVLRQFKNMVLRKFPRFKLARNGSSLGTRQGVVTPDTVWQEMVSEYSGMVKAGLVQNLERFRTQGSAHPDPDDPNRLNVLLPITLMGNLVIFATKLEFRLG